MSATPRVSCSWLNSASDDELDGVVHGIITGMTGSELLPAPVPQTANDWLKEPIRIHRATSKKELHPHQTNAKGKVTTGL